MCGKLLAHDSRLEHGEPDNKPEDEPENGYDTVKDLTPADDAELLRRARTGDREAFGEIVVAHQAAALRLATVICGDSTEAYDIVQESFVRAYRSLSSVRTGDALRPWLMRIVANQAKNSRRGRSRRDVRHARHAALRPTEADAPDAVAMSDLDAERLFAAVAQLRDRDRAVIACRYFADMSEAEAASSLGVAPGTVKSRTARALDRLRSELGADWRFER